MSYTQEQFQAAFQTAIPVDFKVQWKNGTGYLDGSARDTFPHLNSGDRFCFTDDFNRRAVGIVVGNGHNLVIFERYSPTEDGERSKTLVSNTTRTIKSALNWEDGAVDSNQIQMISEFSDLNAYGRCKSIAAAIKLLGV